VKEACELFDGRSDRVFRMLTDRMEHAAAQLHFETAARLRDAFVQIRQLVGKQQALTSAVRNLSLVAVCPSSRPEQVELFLFSRGRLVLQRDLARAQWEESAAGNTFVAELLQRYGAAQAEGSLQVEQEVVDQINIIADWLKNRTGEGQHRELPEDPARLAPGSEEAVALTEWLRAAAAAVVVHSGRSAPREELRSQLALELEG
jgi:excinuclease UvrABC nuclease subunit